LELRGDSEVDWLDAVEPLARIPSAPPEDPAPEVQSEPAPLPAVGSPAPWARPRRPLSALDEPEEAMRDGPAARARRSTGTPPVVVRRRARVPLAAPEPEPPRPPRPLWALGVGLTSGAVLLGGLAFGGFLVQSMRLNQRDQELERHRIAHEVLRHQLARSEEESAAILARLVRATGTRAPEAIATTEAADPLLELSARQLGLRERLDAIERTTRTLDEQRTRVLAETETLRRRADGLSQRLTALEGAHDDLLGRIDTRIEAEIASMREVADLAGLQTGKALAQNGDAAADGRGGPFIAAGEEPVAPADPLLARLAHLDDLLRQHAELEALLRSVPLKPPVEEFTVASGFGLRNDPITGEAGQHSGLDLAAPLKTPVHAAGPGKVTHAGPQGPYGLMVEIDHGHGLVSRYGHLYKALVREGQTVAASDVLGLMGSSGRSTGSHVHFEIAVAGAPVDPMRFLRAGRHVASK
jgi:murein DD-endopeptidase MepM/ murein hydrolase activator NlpD